MSVIKSVNSRSGSRAALRNTLGYVLQDKKTTSDLTLVLGDYPHLDVTADKVFQHFMQTKELFNKTGGRMYKHFVVSWHKDENITPEIALDIARQWAEKVFPEFCTLVTVHTDREHLHCHIVLNSVSMIDGHKYHMNPEELQNAKDINDELCASYGLSITQKGKHFNGKKIEEGTITSYKKDTYNLLTDNKKQARLSEIATAILDVLSYACTKDEFIEELDRKYDIVVSSNWKKKYITFELGTVTVRDKTLTKTFNMDFSKEAIINEITRNKDLQDQFDLEEAAICEGKRELEERVRDVRGEGEKALKRSGYSGSRDNFLERNNRKATETGRFAQEARSGLRGTIKEILGISSFLSDSNEGVAGIRDGARKLASRANTKSRQLFEGIRKLRNFDVSKATEDDIDTAKEFASNMEERRSSIMISIFDIKKMMWYLEKKEDPWYRETLKNYYQELTQKLFDYQCAINEATPLTLKLASKYALNYRGYEEKRAAKTIELVSGGRDEVSDEDLAVLGKEADGFLSNPLDSVDYLIKKHDLEDVRNMPEISRGPRRKHR